MKILMAFLLLVLINSLSAYSEPQTIYSEDKVYITTGQFDFNQSADLVSLTLLKYNDYGKWALNGLQGINPGSEGLIAYFTDVEYFSEFGFFLISYDINLIWPFGRKGNGMKFVPNQYYSDTGELQSIVFIPVLETSFVKKTSLELYIRTDENSGLVSVDYTAKVKLSAFLNFFFNLKAYRKNFEWYIQKVVENLALYLNDL